MFLFRCKNNNDKNDFIGFDLPLLDITIIVGVMNCGLTSQSSQKWNLSWRHNYQAQQVQVQVQFSLFAQTK